MGTGILLIINSSAGIDQEIGSVKIKPSLLMMRECEINQGQLKIVLVWATFANPIEQSP